ncbi:MAG: alcohol dehydrogenase [Synergistales bacterium]|nr:alcohol dehydrogenase [Synergistales bacterium]
MIIASCQVCGEVKVLAGEPDTDGIARTTWICPRCGTGQVMQLQVSTDARGGDLRKICGGMSVSKDGEYISVGNTG